MRVWSFPSEIVIGIDEKLIVLYRCNDSAVSAEYSGADGNLVFFLVNGQDVVTSNADDCVGEASRETSAVTQKNKKSIGWSEAFARIRRHGFIGGHQYTVRLRFWRSLFMHNNQSRDKPECQRSNQGKGYGSYFHTDRSHGSH